MVPTADIEALKALLHQLVGKKPWRAVIGGGSYLALYFGQPVTMGLRGRARGEWTLALSGCVWRIDEEGSVFVGSEDARPRLKAAVPRLEGLSVLSVRLETRALDAVLEFEGGLTLRSFAVESGGGESWLLYTPGNMVAVVGPGPHWIHKSSTGSGAQAGDQEPGLSP